MSARSAGSSASPSPVAPPATAASAASTRASPAFARSEDRRRVLSAGYSEHLAKPVEAAKLVAAVAAAASRSER